MFRIAALTRSCSGNTLSCSLWTGITIDSIFVTHIRFWTYRHNGAGRLTGGKRPSIPRLSRVDIALRYG